jgi:hypothetical protein
LNQNGVVRNYWINKTYFVLQLGNSKGQGGQ